MHAATTTKIETIREQTTTMPPRFRLPLKPPRSIVPPPRSIGPPPRSIVPTPHSIVPPPCSSNSNNKYLCDTYTLKAYGGFLTTIGLLSMFMHSANNRRKEVRNHEQLQRFFGQPQSDTDIQQLPSQFAASQFAASQGGNTPTKFNAYGDPIFDDEVKK
jgi:hypothetical protein